MRWLLIPALIVLMTACGNKGDLYLPTSTKPSPDASPASPMGGQAAENSR